MRKVGSHEGVDVSMCTDEYRARSWQWAIDFEDEDPCGGLCVLRDGL